MFVKKINVDIGKFAPAKRQSEMELSAASLSQKHPQTALPEEIFSKPSTQKTIRKDGEPLALCAHCQEWQPMRWKASEKRGKNANEWFACVVCGCENLKLKMLSYEEAKEQNKKRGFQ